VLEEGHRDPMPPRAPCRMQFTSKLVANTPGLMPILDLRLARIEIRRGLEDPFENGRGSQRVSVCSVLWRASMRSAMGSGTGDFGWEILFRD
jgi:hypothetical protein